VRSKQERTASEELFTNPLDNNHDPEHKLQEWHELTPGEKKKLLESPNLFNWEI